MLNHSLSTLLGQLESGAFGKLLHAKVCPSSRAELTEPLQERVRTSCWPRDGGRWLCNDLGARARPQHSARLPGGQAHPHQATSWTVLC